MSCKGGAPFTQVYIGDSDDARRRAAAVRLQKLGAPVIELEGAAVDSAQRALRSVNRYGLHLAFLDPYSLATLDFSIIKTLAALKRIDMMVHVSRMDLQRNLVTNALAEQSAFDVFAPGWRDRVSLLQNQQALRQQVFEYWRDLVAGLGVWPSEDVRLITGGSNQPLYWLLLAAKHELAHEFWKSASNVEGQGDLFS